MERDGLSHEDAELQVSAFFSEMALDVNQGGSLFEWEELIELINSTQDGEIWVYDSKLKDHLGVVEEALEKDVIHFIRADVGNITTEFIRVSV